MPNNWGQNAVYLQSGDPEAENAASLLYPGQLGTRFTVIEPTRSLPSKTSGAGRPKRYQLVQTDSSMTVAPYRSAVAWWSDQSKYLVTTNSPTTTQTRSRVAGVFVNAITPGNYGCVLITGLGLVKLIDGVNQANVVAGAFVIPSSTNGKADVVGSGSAPTLVSLGTISDPLSFNTTDLTVLVDLQLPDTQ
jgi:hypothetical protein